MTGRTYGQFCGVARALELVGERWSLLVVRDLLLGPKRYTDLRQTLPKIPASILSARLNELEQAGVIRRRVLPQLDAAVVYELTEYGNELEPIMLQLGLWGARSLGEPGMDDVFTLDSAILSLYTTFRPEYAAGAHVTYEVHYGNMVVHAMVDDGMLKVAEGAYPDADLVIVPMGSIKPMLAGEMTPRQALDSGAVRVTGSPELLTRFAEMFRIPPAPARVAGLAVR
ncbi:DNA-binding transcriptional regulator, HxlR family [Amycolatopsis arida]|uniref:DNA-binding transcriptional regulator, HxlR family n=1 Tax=Amycolatopsis arida TaxID=587909 RepID=A0A1I5MJV5_9PSEU|nr:helix-turn-helix domain-containing protein [Amycolatopsis arida]TDX94121.1 DNA-binding HxlR family transcriptional regulator [Amycolatopsis arida]SFP09862.1 DNA-binding transcriptional regulator, HxlR family [Amycolatopsis arida]